MPGLVGVLAIDFLLMQVVPADPAMVPAGLRTELGHDRPIIEQFALYVWRLAHGDLGVSIINNSPVAEELGRTLGPTFELLIASVVWSIPLGLAVGTLSAARRGGWWDRGVMVASVASVSVPVFFMGALLVWFVGFRWQMLPFTGRGGPLWTASGLRSVALPALTLGTVFIGPVVRMTRSSVLDALGAEHVRTARAKGLNEPVVVVRHALRNALIPVLPLVGLQVGYLLGGAVVTETIFSWPGVGRLAVVAVLSADYPMAQGTILVLAGGFIIINLGLDLLYAYLDPRITVS